ncbi:hypothetical protein L2E82_30271 [Cichorium intybus]|uniref:Uncharacterized protein n=1 Tax=Cichorium intybus TaxID=13427 RepID=A0ACB9CZX3_CICIN|nr:hypothetical protein L2E82_30271 [Cichorium intybus]
MYVLLDLTSVSRCCLPKERHPDLPITTILHPEDHLASSSSEDQSKPQLASASKKSSSSESSNDSSSDESSGEDTPSPYQRTSSRAAATAPTTVSQTSTRTTDNTMSDATQPEPQAVDMEIDDSSPLLANVYVRGEHVSRGDDAITQWEQGTNTKNDDEEGLFE